MGQNFKGDGNFGISNWQVSLKVFVIEDIVDRGRDSFCSSPDKSIRQASSDIPFCSTCRCSRVTDLNSVNQSMPCTFSCGVHIVTNKVSETSLSSAIAE
ncbi:hypothetical protein TNCV_182311 [Trichonephila clavipes]|nr:hypothetical protein TNCV_182311 [Trichonephila clavipes]